MNDELVGMMEGAGVKPTSNRILVLRELVNADAPLSLIELEYSLGTLDRSSIQRVLTILNDHHIIHAVEDGRGVAKYELCHGSHDCSVDDMHVHFYCERCERVYCFEQIAAPHVATPQGFTVRSVNYMLKGLCPACADAGGSEVTCR